MKTTKQLMEEEYEFLRDKAYIEAERYARETELMWELYEQEKSVKVVLGKVKKRRKLAQHARVTTRKLPRFVRIQLNYRRVQAATDIWDRPEPPIRTGMLSGGD
jgi:hypothetical protein